MTRSRRTVSLLSVILALAVSLLTVGHAQPARADAAAGEYACLSGQFCLWSDYYAFGVRSHWRIGQINQGVRLPSATRRTASSGYNRTPYTVRAFFPLNCTDPYDVRYFDWPPYTYLLDLSEKTMASGRLVDDAIGSLAPPYGYNFC